MGNDRDVSTCSCSTQHLTARQAEVLCLAAAGLTADQMAQCLGTTTRTVEDHLRTMRQRTTTRNGVELVARGFAAGILVPGSWPPQLSGRRCMSVGRLPTRAARP
jgi:DNA-binding CsgD family transcriptional regulator